MCVARLHKQGRRAAGKLVGSSEGHIVLQVTLDGLNVKVNGACPDFATTNNRNLDMLETV